MANKSSSSSSSSLLDWFLLITNILAFAAMVFFNIASTIPIKGLFDNSADTVSQAVTIDITPDGWTFSTWAVIYTFQGLWLLFNLILMCMSSDDKGVALYKNPKVFNKQFHLFVCANFLLNISWLFLWDAGHFGISFGVILLMTGTIFMAAIIVHHNVFRASEQLNKTEQQNITEQQKKLKNRLPVKIGYYLFANNGLACYGTWLVVATTINLAIAWTYEWTNDPAAIQETASITALSVISIIVIGYFVLDIFVFEKYTRFTFSVYLELAYALAGILTQNWTSKNQTTSAIFALVIACVVGNMFIFKVIFSLRKHKHSKTN